MQVRRGVAQLFSRRTGVALNLTLIALIVLPAAAGAVWWRLYNSPLRTRRNVAIEQPIPFSHKHHSGELGIDCRYCHATVTRSSFAGIPPVQTCMTCHSKVWRTAAILEPVRAAARTGIVLPWVRVNDLPQFAVFDHSAHVTHGVSCVVCHGHVERMDVVAAPVVFDMRWCLKCHRDPERYLGKGAVARYRIETKHLMDCVTCHR